eukprot:Anaeramoba_flamelloidesa571551_47.p1 GENE.a571551_47~~a571551_47.p1  ORF type:complete len:227 (-),score=47.66 a571551_47:840-1520(-)
MNLSTELRQQQQQEQQQDLASHQTTGQYAAQMRLTQNTLPYQQMRYPPQYFQSFQYFKDQMAFNQNPSQNYQLKQVPLYQPTTYMSNYPNMVQLKPNSFQDQFRKNDQSPKRIIQFPLTSPVKQPRSPINQRTPEKEKKLNSDNRELNNQHLIFQNLINQIRIIQNQQSKTSNNQKNSCLQKTETQKPMIIKNKSTIRNTNTSTNTSKSKSKSTQISHSLAKLNKL